MVIKINKTKPKSFLYRLGSFNREIKLMNIKDKRTYLQDQWYDRAIWREREEVKIPRVIEKKGRGFWRWILSNLNELVV